MTRPAHRLGGQIDSVQKRGLSPGLDRQEPIQDLAASIREVDKPLHAGVELYQSEFIVRISSVQYVRHRLTRLLQFRPHASARVEDNCDGHGRNIRPEM